MAILAFSRKDRNGAASIAAHPAFPAIVAMWFAVLLGLGTLVLPAAIVERTLPPMKPPLGMSAQTVIALAAATAGALAGFAAARRIAASGANTSLADSRSESGVRPLSAHDELGDLFDWSVPGVPDREDVADQIDPAPRVEEVGADSGLTELVERLGQAIERHRRLAMAADRTASAFAPEPASYGYVSDDTEAALRSALARLRQLRGAA